MPSRYNLHKHKKDVIQGFKLIVEKAHSHQ